MIVLVQYTKFLKQIAVAEVPACLLHVPPPPPQVVMYSMYLCQMTLQHPLCSAMQALQQLDAVTGRKVGHQTGRHQTLACAGAQVIESTAGTRQ